MPDLDSLLLFNILPKTNQQLDEKFDFENDIDYFLFHEDGILFE